MKLIITFFCFLFPLLLFSQTLSIDAHKKFADSIVNHIEEERIDGVIRYSHGRKDGKQIRELMTNTLILKNLNKTIRICYRERHPETDEELNIYFLDDKLIYAEKVTWRKKKFFKQIFYYENESLIHSENSKEAGLDSIDVLIEARSLFKQASS
ncbi:hypothetical protein [Flavobacterium pallidum]|uniref:Uncharacterized protein n=1 Tax=Flavobacterium pallidum TaxID=2172098 RepID=A0A2S1SKE4_9FLAO|nr:hypothetical protein [Flavobacterium pallidum]AWI26807.1 hypothetical protein HYN49_13370 [Flavobacterium pallidum]